MNQLVLGKLGQWLREEPQPDSLIADGKPIAIGRGGAKWRNLVRTIETLGATQIEALDRAGTVLRAVTIEDEEESSLKLTAGVNDLQVFARLLAEGYDKGSRASQPLLENAMSFIERQSVRLAAAEREIERLRALNMKLQSELIQAASSPAQEGNGTLEALVTGFLQAQNGVGPATALGEKK